MDGSVSFNVLDPNQTPLILDQKSAPRCHILLPGMNKPTGAIFYRKQFYSYVKSFPTQEAALRGAERLLAKGNAVILTRVAKGLILWVLEPDAQLAKKRLIK
jgi:hypothetical protein